MADFIIGTILGALGSIFRALPRQVTLSIGRGIGNIGYAVAGKRRRLTLDNLKKALGEEKSDRELKTVARKSFSNLGMALVEYFTFPSLDIREAEKISEVEGEEHLKDAVEKGQGVLALTVHLDNVDLAGALLALRGFPIAIIAKPVRNPAVDRALINGREATGVKVFSGGGTMKEILRHLRSAGIVGFVLDQNAVFGDGVFVPFFGREASTLNSLAILARRTGIPVIPIHMFRDGLRHRIIIDPPIKAKVIEDREEDVLERTKQYAAWTEGVIRQHPDQWMWLHNRWRIRPPGESL